MTGAYLFINKCNSLKFSNFRTPVFYGICCIFLLGEQQFGILQILSPHKQLILRTSGFNILYRYVSRILSDQYVAAAVQGDDNEVTAPAKHNMLLYKYTCNTSQCIVGKQSNHYDPICLTFITNNFPSNMKININLAIMHARLNLLNLPCITSAYTLYSQAFKGFLSAC